MKGESKISLCMIVKNESVFLANCLDEARPHSSEMIVVDTGSTDGTVEIARTSGARVLHFDWVNDFARARNFSVSQAASEWILCLDADEHLEETDWLKLTEFVKNAGTDTDCFDLEQVNYSRETHVVGFRPNTFGAKGFTDYPGYTSSWLTRLFKRAAGFCFQGAVHEHLARDGRVVDGPKIPVRIHHHGQALSPEKLSQKKRLYLEIGKNKVREFPENAKNWHELGVACLETGDLPEAEKHFHEAVRLEPKNGDYRIALGIVLKQQKKMTEALNCMDPVSDRHPMVHGARGCCYSGLGEFGNAVLSFKKQILVNPDFTQARQWLYESCNAFRKSGDDSRPTLSVCFIVKNEEEFIGRCLANVKPHADEIIVLDTGSTDRTKDIAREHGARVIEETWRDDFSWARNQSLSHATSEWILVLDADELLSGKDWTELWSVLKQGANDMYWLIQTNYSEASSAMNWKANELDVPESRGFPGYIESPLVRLFRNTPKIRFKGAVHEHASHEDPSVLPQPTRIRIHHDGKFRDEKRNQAKNDLYERLGRKKITERPLDAQAYHELAIQLMESGKPHESERYFLRALELDPKMREPLFGYAGFLLNERRYPEALEMYHRYVASHPDDPQAYIYLSSVLIELKKFEPAKECLDRARSLGTGHSVSMDMNEGVILLNLGRPDEAREKFLEACRINPQNPSLWTNLALVEIVKKDFARARGYLDKTIELKPDDDYAHKKLGEILFNLGDRERSLEHFLKSSDLNPAATDVLSHVVLCAHFLGRENLVRDYERRLCARQHEDPACMQVITRILDLYAKRQDFSGIRRLTGLISTEGEGLTQ